jgi:2',3'-cyclic-nucleotide 2'-phosphodiesterase (5'-nucleotidase family)
MISRSNNISGERLRSLLRSTVFLLVMALTCPAFAATLAGWNVSTSTGWGASPLAATVTDPNLTVGGLTRGSGVGISGTAAGRAWGGNNWLGASAVAAATANQFATFSITANPGKQVSFGSISKFDYRRSATGASNGVIQYQIGTGAFTDIATVSYTVTTSGGGSIAPIDLSAISALQNVPPGTPVSFRIVNYGGTTASGTWYIYDVAISTASDFEISGTVTDSAIPVSYTLTTATSGNGSGSISGTANPYASGSSATITATAGTNSIFTGWSGCSSSTTPIISVLMNSSTICTANFTATAATLSIFHVNDTHARLTPHKLIIPAHGTATGPFEDIGGAAHMAGKMLQLTAANPNSLVIDAGDISEGNPIGDMNGNGSMTQFYTLLSGKLLAQRGRGMDAVVVGNHDVRDSSYIANLDALKASGVPVLSVNVRDVATGLPHFDPYNIVTVNGKKVGIIGYTTQAAQVGASLASSLVVADCNWSSTGPADPITCHLADYVNTLRSAPYSVDIVVLAAHIGHSALVDPVAPLLIDNGAAKLPEVVVTGHWHNWAENPAWQPAILNYNTIFTEAGSYMNFIGELQLTDTGRYFSATNHVLRNADITPDPDAQALVAALTANYNSLHPGHPVDEVLGYTADNLLLDNEMKWWSANEYPWSGNNTAGQFICDAMRWKSEQIFGQTDLAIETGGGVRADIPAGPVTYLQIYETFPWNDDFFNRINMTGQEIVNFLKQTNLNAGFSSALHVTAYDGVPTSITFNGAPIDLAHTYTVAINNYMYAHPPTGWVWSDTAPLTSPVLCRDGIVDFMRQFTPSNPYSVGGPRYSLNTEFSGGYRAVVTMMNDSESKPAFEDAFIRFLSATPETLVRRGTPQVPADLVNGDGTINPMHHLAEQELYRSYLGFKAGVLKPGDIVETWGKGSFFGGNPEFVDQEGIQADGVEFKIVGHDLSLAKPAFMSSVGAFWTDFYKNHYVQFLARKAGADTVADQFGKTIKLWDATGYAAKVIPGVVGDTLLVSGVPTMENFGMRFRCDSVTASSATLPATSAVSSHIDQGPVLTTTSPLALKATAATTSGTYFFSPVADAQVASGNPTTNYGTGTNIFVQSSTSGFGNERGWLRFDLSGIPAAATIASANLQLWNWKATGAALPTEVLGSTDDSWLETGITWNSQPVFGTALATQTLVSGTTNVQYSWDVSSFVLGKWNANKLVSLVVKPVSEGSTDVVPPSYGFDAREYGSNGPVLQVNTQASAATITQVDFYYRYSADNSTWSAWTLYSSSLTAPFTASFPYPQGYGYYEFYSRATDSTGAVEPVPGAAQTATHYSAAPPYTTAALVTVGALSATYDGTAKAVSATTIPPGLSVGITYNGSSSIPVSAGTYPVQLTVTQAGFSGSASGVLIIEKAAATVTLGGLNVMFDGTPKGASVTTNPGYLAVIVTYNGSTTVPTEAGTYSVVATVNDPDFRGSAAGTLTIAASTGAVAVPGFGRWGMLAATVGLVLFMARKRKSAV